MKLESVVFAVSGAFFGLIVGWILGSQTPGTASAVLPPPTTAAAPGSGAPEREAVAVDEARVQRLVAAAESDPNDSEARTVLGNLYFDAERYDEASRWYEAVLAIDQQNPDVSTDLGVSYYYTNQPDRALQQFDHSLSVDPQHSKTLLNQGIVRAFGKQDLQGAAEAWEAVIRVAPGTPEAGAAQQALDSLARAHPGSTGGAPAAQGDAD